MTTNFIPRRRSVTGVTVESTPTITTADAHGYSVLEEVSLHVSGAYGMRIEGNNAKILSIPSSTTFVCNLSTLNQSPFVEPTVGTKYTQAHVVPVDGLFRNYTSITGASGA